MQQRPLRGLGLSIAIAGACAPQIFALPWPVAPSNESHPILTSYGQFAADGQSGSFHEATDIIVPEAPADATVSTIEIGEILDIIIDQNDPYNSEIVISRGSDLTKALVYRHVALSPDLLCRQPIQANTAIGQVVKRAGVARHLHIGIYTDNNGFRCLTPPFTNINPSKGGDPMRLLLPAGDAVTPTVESIQFRNGKQERFPPATYFEDFFDGRNIIYGSVDIIAKAYDRFGSHAPHIGIQKVGFLATGPRAIPPTTLVNFYRDDSLFVPEANNNLRFSDPVLGAVIYERDNKVQTLQDVQAGISDLYYIVTNVTSGRDAGAQILEEDADRYWNTQRSRFPDENQNPPAWNDKDFPNIRAIVQEDAQFPDGTYNVEVFADDRNGSPGRGSKIQPVVIDNFHGFLKRAEIRAAGGGPFYTHRWDLNQGLFGGPYYEKTSPFPAQPLGAGQFVVELTFSEPVKNPTIEIAGS